MSMLALFPSVKGQTMHQSDTRPLAVDPLAGGALQQCRVVHSLDAIASLDPRVLPDITTVLSAWGHAIQVFRGIRVGAVMEYRISLVGISERDSQLVRDSLQKVPGVQRVRLEHRIDFIRSGAAGAPRHN